MIKEFFIDVGVAIVRRISKGVLFWFFDPAKWKKGRERKRRWWYKYHLRAQKTPGKLDDQIAMSIAKGMKFRTAPNGIPVEIRVAKLLGQALVEIGNNRNREAAAIVRAASELLAEARV